MSTYTLQKKSFFVEIPTLHENLKSSSLQNKFNGIVKEEENVSLLFFEELDQQETDLVDSIFSSHESNIFTKRYTERLIKGAVKRGNEIFTEFAAENVAMGITQAGKTKAVADYLANVDRYMRSGSLYEVLNELTKLENEGFPSELAPFITSERIGRVRDMILSYLNQD